MNSLKEQADQYLREHRIIELFEVNLTIYEITEKNHSFTRKTLIFLINLYFPT